jgi:hypothetical protein
MTQMTELDRQKLLSARKEVGRNIDPETAEVCWGYGLTIDPYGIYPDLPEEFQQVGRVYFARSPHNDIWVNFGDLPDSIRDALWRQYRSQIAFPAGLELRPTTRRFASTWSDCAPDDGIADLF